MNHAAISPLSIPVTEAIGSALSGRSSGEVDTFQMMLDNKSRLKQNISRLIHTESENIAIIGNTSEGFNWLVNGLNWERGDHVLLVQDEFPSNVYPFLNLKSSGVNIDFVPVRDGVICIEDIEKSITSRTRLLSISFVEFFSGFRNDLETIGQLCKSKDILFSVDGIQGVGAIPIDVKAAQIDFMSNGGHKWLMSPMGCGFMYINPGLHVRLKPAFVGWLSVKDSWNFTDYDLDFLDDSGRYEIGTPNFLGIVGAQAATKLLVEAGPENIFPHLLSLGDLLIKELENIGMRYQGSYENKHRSGIYTFQGDRIEELFEYLKSNKIHTALRMDAIRISPHFYNQPDEVRQIIDICTRFYKI